MAYTSIETKVQVMAGDAEHVGILEVNGVIYLIQKPVVGNTEPPPYDYDADAEAVFRFLSRFLPRETWLKVQRLMWCDGT